MGVDPRADEDDGRHHRQPGDDREVHEDEDPVVGLPQRAEQAGVASRIEGDSLRVALHPREKCAQAEAAEDDPPQGERGRLEALREGGARDPERLVRLLGQLVEVVVKHRREEERPEPHGDGGVRAPLEVSERHGARGGAHRDAAERDEVRAGGEVGVRHERHGGPDQDRDTPQTLALDARRGVASGGEQEAAERERQKGAPRGKRVADGADIEVERRVLGLDVKQGAGPQVEVFRLGGDRAHGHRGDAHARNEGYRSHDVPDSIRRAMPRRDSPDAPCETHREQRYGEAQQSSPALEAHEEAHGRHPQPRRARLERRRTGVVAIERRDRQPAERHGEPRHRADVAQHGAGLHEVERHGGQHDRRIDAGPAIEEPRDERVRCKDAEEAPEGQGQPPGPLVQTEELEAERDRRERELRATEIVEVRQRIVRAVEREVARVEQVVRDATRQIGDVQLVGVPQAVASERRDGEEEQRGDGRGHRKRSPSGNARRFAGRCAFRRHR